MCTIPDIWVNLQAKNHDRAEFRLRKLDVMRWSIAQAKEQQRTAACRAEWNNLSQDKLGSPKGQEAANQGQ